MQSNSQLIFLSKSYVVLSTLILAICGTLIQAFSYFSYDPIKLTFIFFFIGFIIVNIFFLPSRDKIFFYFYLSLAIFFSGIMAIFFNQFGADDFNTPDAGNFYRWSAIHDWVGQYSLFDTRIHNSKNFTEGGLAIYTWRVFYDILSMIGIEKNHYVGIYLNNILVAFTALISIRTLNLIYHNDKIKRKLFIYLFSLSAIHLLYK